MNRNDGEAGQAQITVHYPHYRVEPDLLDKGLRHDPMGLPGSTASSLQATFIPAARTLRAMSLPSDTVESLGLMIRPAAAAALYSASARCSRSAWAYC